MGEVIIMANVVLNVDGMSCGHCVNSIEGALSEEVGIVVAKVNLSEKNVMVTYKEDVVTLDKIKEVIEEQGYDIKA